MMKIPHLTTHLAVTPSVALTGFTNISLYGMTSIPFEAIMIGTNRSLSLHSIHSMRHIV